MPTKYRDIGQESKTETGIYGRKRVEQRKEVHTDEAGEPGSQVDR